MNASDYVANRNFCNHFVFHPPDAPTRSKQWLYLLSTIALGIITAGLFHLICAIALSSRKVSVGPASEEEDEKTSQVFENTVNSDEDKHLLIRTIKENAGAGDKDYQFQLAKLYMTGKKGVTKNYERAFLWFWKAAKQGHVKAQYYTAAMYHGGNGTNKNIMKAAKMYLRAAKGGDPRAQFHIAVMYMEGIDGSEPNPAEAKKWYHESALQGYVKAQANLGVLYANERSFEKAIIWLEKAAAQGSEKAKENLAIVRNIEHEELNAM